MDISREFAEQEFNRFCVAMDLDVTPDKLTNEDKAGLENQRRMITGAIQDGRLIINDEGEPVFTPGTESTPEPIVFKEPTGATFLAMDKRKEGQTVGKLNAMLGDMTHQPPARFARMKNRDYKICQALITVFLG